MENRKELQEKLIAHRALENRLNSLVRQQNIFASKIVELQSTIDSINEITEGKNADILFPLGSAAYTKGTVADKGKLIVEVGAGVALEKTAEEGKAILEGRKKEIENAMNLLQAEIQNVSATMQQIESEAQKLVSEAQQAEEKFGVVSPE